MDDVARKEVIAPTVATPAVAEKRRRDRSYNPFQETVMAKKATSGARDEAVADLLRQIGGAARMAKKLRAKSVSWNLGTKWIENHLDYLVECVRELKKMPEDAASETTEPAFIPAPADLKDQLIHHRDSREEESSGRRRGKQHQETTGNSQ